MNHRYSDLLIRPEQSHERGSICALLTDAFGRDTEARIVDSLRASDAFLPELTLVAVQDCVVVGHIMISRLTFVADSGDKIATSLLAPLAVAPARQNRRIGAALTRAALDKARRSGFESMILVGHPTYYPRFGFKPASTWGIRYVTQIPDEVFMASELAQDALANASGIVTLPAAFDQA
jgi:putative acetyltransferase